MHFHFFLVSTTKDLNSFKYNTNWFPNSTILFMLVKPAQSTWFKSSSNLVTNILANEMPLVPCLDQSELGEEKQQANNPWIMFSYWYLQISIPLFLFLNFRLQYICISIKHDLQILVRILRGSASRWGSPNFLVQNPPNHRLYIPSSHSTKVWLDNIIWITGCWYSAVEPGLKLSAMN